MTSRVDRLRGELDGLGAASFLVSNPVNVRYLTGFESSNAFVLVGRRRAITQPPFFWIRLFFLD